MYIDRKTQNKYVGLTLLLAVGIFTIRAIIFGKSFFPYVYWNMFLAWLPWAISKTVTGSEKRLVRWGKGLAWLLFLPNSFYLATDLIHLRESTEISFWIDLVMLLSFTSSAFLMGFYSFNNIEKVFTRNSTQHVQTISRILLFAACSYGVYMGRILRWNTWDLVVRPGAVLQSVFDSVVTMHPHSLAFTISLSFFLFLFLTYQFFFVKRNQIHN